MGVTVAIGKPVDGVYSMSVNGAPFDGDMASVRTAAPRTGLSAMFAANAQGITGTSAIETAAPALPARRFDDFKMG